MTNGTRILVVEDDRSIARLVQLELEHRDFAVRCAYDGHAGLEAVSEFRPAAIVLDIMLPELDGVGVLKKLRAAGNRVPVIMLTARSTSLDKVHSLDLGADDYVTKPFSLGELISRIRAILRRQEFERSHLQRPVREIGTLRLDFASHLVTVNGRDVELTPSEFKILVLLAERRGRVQGRAHLLETVWEAAPDIQTRTVDMHVQRLRAKLGPAGDLIETVRGFGYRYRRAAS